jgi:hypothetical protein
LSILTHEIVVRRYRHPTDFAGDIQQLERLTKFRGRVIWRTVLDREPIPAWAVIELGTMGETSWRSKFKDYIK